LRPAGDRNPSSPQLSHVAQNVTLSTRGFAHSRR
jgi:hypothetical protein